MKTSDQLEIIRRGSAEIISEEQLAALIERSKKNKIPLRIKAGFDPTAPDIHLGHTVLLRKLRQFQDLGHTVLFLIGDFTARIGDPSGQNQMRPQMSEKEIKRNAQTYKNQVFKILDEKKTKVVFNARWLAKLDAKDIMGLVSHVSVAQLIARADFKKRLQDSKEVSLLEFMYPLLQAYDSVYLKADIEIGGIDQKFNLLMARQLQTYFHQEPQVVVMMPLLEGTDGVHKMSKSIGNYIGINEASGEIFGKTMSISDNLMWRYYELLTDYDLQEYKKKFSPMEAKINLAKHFVEAYHKERAAQEAEVEFRRVFSNRSVPADMPSYSISSLGGIVITELLVKSHLVASGNEARRLLKQGAVYFENKRITDERFIIPGPGIVKIGKRKFLKVK
ncbi:tyrosine--tRNA ligase [Candidatus Omnitrophota bacterium]